MQHTENFDLNIIETSDAFGPEALNENTRKLDTVLAEMPFAVFGSYKGDGKSYQLIDLGFKPKAVLVFRRDGVTTISGNPCSGLALAGSPVTLGGITHAVEISNIGFYVYYSSTNSYANYNGYTYNYIAFR